MMPSSPIVRRAAFTCGALALVACGGRLDLSTGGATDDGGVTSQDTGGGGGAAHETGSGVEIDAGTDARSGGGGGGGTSGCPGTNPGMCAPTPPGTCIDGHAQTGEATCVDGAWVCGVTDCAVTDGGASDAACNGSPYSYCGDDGRVHTGCCGTDDPCAPRSPYCDLGSGNCSNEGACPSDDGGTCDSGSIEASSYNQTCSTNADCVAVYQGEFCDECFCPNAAISATAEKQYDTDLANGNPHPSACGCPLAPAPTCVSGTCVMPVTGL